MTSITEWLLLSYALVLTVCLGIFFWFYQKKVAQQEQDKRNTLQAHGQALQEKTEAVQALQLLGVEAKQWEAQLQELKPQYLQLQEENRHLGLENATLTTEKMGLLQQLSEQQQRYAAELAELKIQHEKAVQESKKEVSSLWDEKIKNHLTQTLKASAEADEEQRLQGFKQLTAPIQTMLQEYQQKIELLNKEHSNSVAVLDRNIGNLYQMQSQLATVLKTNKGAGDWGELILERILEMAGLKKDIDYYAQDVLSDGSRPDIVVHLPEERFIVIDAKAANVSVSVKMGVTVPATTSAQEEEGVEPPSNADTILQGKALIKSIEDAVKNLYSKKNHYLRARKEMPEFMVLFLPKESLFSEAMSIKPELWQFAWEKKVVISSPFTLIPLLRMVEASWTRVKLTNELINIKETAQKMHAKFCTFTENYAGLLEQYEKFGQSINQFKTPITGQGGLLSLAKHLEALKITTKVVSPKLLEKLEVEDFNTESSNHPIAIEPIEPVALPAFSSVSTNN
jgi:DNA recombination protein RmuC